MVIVVIVFQNRNSYYQLIQYFEQMVTIDLNYIHWVNIVFDCRIYVFQKQLLFHVKRFVHGLFDDVVFDVDFVDVVKIVVRLHLNQHHYF